MRRLPRRREMDAATSSHALLPVNENWPALFLAAGAYVPPAPVAERCDCCGRSVLAAETASIRRGALTIFRHPDHVTWDGRPVHLSPTEVSILTTIAALGTATYRQIEEAIQEAGSDPRARRVWIERIRKKLRVAGAGVTLVKVGRDAWMLPADL